MASVWLRVTVELRRRWVSWAAIALIIGIAGGAAVGGLTGARRTATSFQRFSAWAHADTMRVVYTGSASPTPAVAALFERLALLPGTIAVRYQIIAFTLEAPIPGQDRLGVAGFAGDQRLFTAIDKAKMLGGRRPREDAPDEVAVTPGAARSLRIGVGSVLTVRPLPLGQLDRVADGLYEPFTPPGPTPLDNQRLGMPITLHVVGVETAPGDREFTLGGTGNLHLSAGFLTRWPNLASRPAVAIRSNEPAPAMRTRLHQTLLAGQPVSFFLGDTGATRTIRSTHVLATALDAFGVLLALVTFIAVGESLGRQIEHETPDHEVLLELGMTRRQLVSAVVIEVGFVAAVGGVFAAVVAVATSPFTPIGLARQIEPHPGYAVNAAWLAGGFVLIMFASIAVAAIYAVTSNWSRDVSTSWRTAGEVQKHIDLSGPLVPTSVLVGIRLAADRSHGRRGSLGAALVGSILAVGALTAALSFDAGLSQLLTTPRLYGWNWDAYVGNPFRGLSVADSDQIRKALTGDLAISGFSEGTFTAIQVNREPRTLPVEGLKASVGSVVPPLVEGRAPSDPNDIVVGADDLHVYNLHIGDEFDASSLSSEGGARPQARRLRIVGRAVFAHMVGNQSSGPLASGAWMTLAGLQALFSSPGAPTPSVNEFLVQFAKGVKPATELERLRAEVERPPFYLGVRGPDTPTDVNNIGRINQLPTILAGLLAAVAVVVLGHALVVTVWRRRVDVAILRSLGFVRRQVFMTVIAQALILTGVGLGVGLPLGVVGGQSAWRAFASQLGIVPARIQTPAAVLLIVPATFLVAAAIATVPARLALAIDPSTALRDQ